MEGEVVVQLINYKSLLITKTRAMAKKSPQLRQLVAHPTGLEARSRRMRVPFIGEALGTTLDSFSVNITG